MPNVEVNCTITNCTFHAKGNICGADRITIDMENNSKFDTEFADEFVLKSRSEVVNQSGDTCCKTFKPKSI